MSLITSMAEAESIKRQGSAAVSRSGSVGTNFGNVLRDGLSGVAEDMDTIFEEAAAKYGLSSNLVRAVAKAESNFNPKAVSKAGAVGVMQLMPGTAKLLGVTDAYDARQNIMGGAKYLKENLDRFGDTRLALAAYNAGPNSVKKYGGIPPYQETQSYVKKVMSYLEGTPILANKSVTTGAIGSNPELFSKRNVGNLPLRDTISMDKDSFTNLLQLLRLQMMMNADREVGTLDI
ncbi:MAG: lytic transglycosylase domain-containing protein [Lachnospiraceae bacterium]